MTDQEKGDLLIQVTA